MTKRFPYVMVNLGDESESPSAIKAPNNRLSSLFSQFMQNSPNNLLQAHFATFTVN